jgi:predicted nucleic acid-binding protein
MNLVADTNGLIRLQVDSPLLGSAARRALLDSGNNIHISALVLAELQHSYRKGKHGVSLERALGWIQAVDNALIVAVTLRLVQSIPAGLDIHDGVIVATAFEVAEIQGQPCPVVTSGEAIRQPGVVSVIW